MGILVELFCVGLIPLSVALLIRFIVKSFTCGGCKGDCKTCGGCRKRS